MWIGSGWKSIAGCVAAVALGSGLFVSEARAAGSLEEALPSAAAEGQEDVVRFEVFGLEVAAGPIRDVTVIPSITPADKVLSLCVETWTECADVWVDEDEEGRFYWSPLDAHLQYRSLPELAGALIEGFGFNVQGKHVYLDVLENPARVRIWIEGHAAPMTVREYRPGAWGGDVLPFHAWPSVKAAAETYASHLASLP